MPCRTQKRGRSAKVRFGKLRLVVTVVAAGAAERRGPVAKWTLGSVWNKASRVASVPGTPSSVGALSEGPVSCFPASVTGCASFPRCGLRHTAFPRTYASVSRSLSSVLIRRPQYFSDARCLWVSALSPGSRTSWSTCFKELFRDLDGVAIAL